MPRRSIVDSARLLFKKAARQTKNGRGRIGLARNYLFIYPRDFIVADVALSERERERERERGRFENETKIEEDHY